MYGLNSLIVLQCVLFLSMMSELRRSNAGIPLRDHDQTNLKEGDWTKINTLGHYRLAEMVRGRREERGGREGEEAEGRREGKGEPRGNECEGVPGFL